MRHPKRDLAPSHGSPLQAELAAERADELALRFEALDEREEALGDAQRRMAHDLDQLGREHGEMRRELSSAAAAAAAASSRLSSPPRVSSGGTTAVGRLDERELAAKILDVLRSPHGARAITAAAASATSGGSGGESLGLCVGNGRRAAPPASGGTVRPLHEPFHLAPSIVATTSDARARGLVTRGGAGMQRGRPPSAAPAGPADCRLGSGFEARVLSASPPGTEQHSAAPPPGNARLRPTSAPTRGRMTVGDTSDVAPEVHGEPGPGLMSEEVSRFAVANTSEGLVSSNRAYWGARPATARA